MLHYDENCAEIKDACLQEAKYVALARLAVMYGLEFGWPNLEAKGRNDQRTINESSSLLSFLSKRSCCFQRH